MPSTDRLRSALADRYSIQRELGSGGMATVYLARDLKHDREVALKVLRSDLSAVIGTDRFLAEVRIAARLDHPHILTLIDSGSAEGILYYVLPYVRGDSLRARLEREKQLGVEDALSIVKQVASALDYAHAQGVVHRDIKPENILFHEGEAVLADFGIALAVREAGGNRLTETGLSLGTPQYMSPEQATGDRALDRRSDVYSLAAVFYEMITGEPPVTGATAQAVVAKLLTEKPVKLRVVRETVPPEMERATEKALAKVPADRFASAGEFARALSLAAPAEKQPGFGPAKVRLAALAGAAVLMVASGLWMARGRLPGRDARVTVTLRDRTQLTNTGGVAIPEISDDGRTIAYVVTDCSSRGCRYGIELQDVPGGSSRRLFEGASALYNLEISPDRRNLIFLGTINGVFGSYIVSTLGGPPRYVVNGYAGFWAGGDSLLLTRLTRPADAFWILASGLDGAATDSLRIERPADATPWMVTDPNSRWVFYHVTKGSVNEWVVADRNGKLYSSIALVPGERSGGAASSDALWLQVFSQGSPTASIVRIPFDSATGQLAQRGDTVYTGRLSRISITADGGTLLHDEGTTDYSGWLLSFDDLIRGRFSDDARLFRATSNVGVSLSPEGTILAIGREGGSGERGMQWSIRPWTGGAETPIPGRHIGAVLLDSTTVKLVGVTASGTQLSVFDFRTRRRNGVLTVPEARLRDASRLGDDTWAWIPASGRSVQIQRDGEPRARQIPLPSWYKDVYWVSGSPDGRSVSFAGWKAPGEDSLGVGVISMPEGRVTHLWSTFAESAETQWLEDGTLLVSLWDTPESITFYRLRPGSPVERLGSTPRPTMSVRVSHDLKRVVALTRDHRRDAWMSRVVR